MNLTLAYRGRSAITATPSGLAVALEPNLRRDRVAFEGVLRQPVRFREAIGAMHEVVVSDFRTRPKDKSAYQAYLAEQKKREDKLRNGVANKARQAIVDGLPELPEAFTPEFERKHNRLRSRYWAARDRYTNYLWAHDRELLRLLMPCDPVITVAPDCLFFECFSADESSYGCLTVGRDAFAAERDVALGTTNVDYSWTLYEHFQRLRSYRETRFFVDPSGFEVRTEGDPEYREEKIDLPPSWLRGFMQLQAAMSLPMRRVAVDRAGLYNVLAYLNRHRARRSPRAVRFELTPGRPARLVLEPWEQAIDLHATPYDGPRPETVRTWGRDRLRLLARLLPLAEGAEVYLLGTGLPSFWSINLGAMRLLLGLSGWTANDWTGASALDALAPPAEPGPALLADIAAAFRHEPARPFAAIRRAVDAPDAAVAAGLNRLALMGQIIHDLPAGLYRWRRVMPAPLAIEQVAPESPETAASRRLVAERKVRIDRDEHRPDGLHLLEGQSGGRPASLVLDADGRMLRGQCTCSHHHTGGLRRGPCRHLQALRAAAIDPARPASLEAWFQSLGT